jgi:Tfp pilus assembly protein PilF/polysaccharide pyruvyl transferase WcaK-like protein
MASPPNPELNKAVDDLVGFAVTRHQAGDLAGAEALYAKALSLAPTQAVALHNLGLIHLGSGRNASALTLLREAVRQNPQEAAFRYNLAVALQQDDQLEAALAQYAAATERRPDYREAWENRGVVLQDLHRLDAAIAAYRRALQVDALAPVACLNLPKALRAAGRDDEALGEYRRVLDLCPLDPGARAGYGATLVASGDYRAGWPWLESRLLVTGGLANTPYYRVPLPRWGGEPLGRRRLLVYGEQGIGDEIMFASCLPDLARIAEAPPLLLCEPRLVPLFARSFPHLAVTPMSGEQPEPGAIERWRADCCVASGSLPLHFRQSAADFPGTPYLAADAAAVARWRDRLAALGDGPKIGLSWRGGNEPRTRQARSIPLAAFAPLLAATDAVFVDVQYGDHRPEVDAFNGAAARPLHRLDDADGLRDMDNFAALLGALDLVIAVDNSTVHLAGALGVPCWVLLPALADWRWPRGREKAPWYASLQLVWQQPGEAPAWGATLARLAARLAAELPALSAAPRPIVAASTPQPLPPDPPPRPRALLVNDTTYWYHWGCTATSLALHAGLHDAGYGVDSLPITALNRLAPLPQRIEDFDDPAFITRFRAANPALCAQIEAAERVVVNGEGSLHGLGQTALALLVTAWIAKVVVGKDTRIVNHSVYPADQGSADAATCEAVYRKVYAALDFVAVREPASLREMQRLGLPPTLSFDCLPLYLQRHPPRRAAGGSPTGAPTATPPTRRVVLAGSVELSAKRLATLIALAERCLAEGCAIELLVGANAFPAADDEVFVNAVHARLRGRYTLVDARSEAAWLATLADAALLISGRFHHTIAAAFQRTPVAVAASNTRKIDGLLESLGLPAADVWLDLDAPEQAIACVRRLLREPWRGLASDATLEALRARALLNFSGLTPAGSPRVSAGA